MTKAPMNMQATAMVLMKILPDWNSLDSVRHVHSVLEFAALIFFGVLVVFDVLAHKEEDRKRERIFEQIGLWFFGIAVLCELVAYPYGQRNDDLSGREIISLDSKAQDAKDAAGGAKTIADSAKATAGTAAALSKTAHDESAAAVTTAGKANTLATGARNEADSYKADIVSAKTGAADAVSRLADAEQRLAESTQREVAAEANLIALKTPRSIAKTEEFVAKLTPFRGMEYTFLGCFQDQDSIELARQLNKVLIRAGWKRVPTNTSNNGLDFHLNIDGDFNTAPSNASGIYVGVQSREAIKDLQSVPFATLPAYFRAAGALKGALAFEMLPRQDDLQLPLNVEAGDNKTVLIIVGNKKL